MMALDFVSGRIPTKRVGLTGCTGQTDEQIVAFAITAAGENRSSLFGWDIRPHEDPDRRTVLLYTD